AGERRFVGMVFGGLTERVGLKEVELEFEEEGRMRWVVERLSRDLFSCSLAKLIAWWRVRG
ncbi:hypothetical protein A2U01_0111153, partial [Trifolium medium]|nr:hypothetical protein [Trifolium medium]